MLENLERMQARFDELTAAMGRPDVASDHLRLSEYARERSELESIVNMYREYTGILSQINEARELLHGEDGELVELAQAELAELEPRAEELLAELRRMLLPRDPRDDKNVIIEVRAGTGGEEAALFAANLARMYMRYAENHNWKTDILSANETGIGG